jgi:hypothetical protein
MKERERKKGRKKYKTKRAKRKGEGGKDQMVRYPPVQGKRERRYEYHNKKD